MEFPTFSPGAVVGLDIETTGLAYDAAVTLIAVSDGTNSYALDVRAAHPAEVGAWLTTLYSHHTIVGHNLQFDLPRLHNAFGCHYPYQPFDTMLAEALLTAGLDTEEDEETGEERHVSRSLQATAKRRLGVWLSKDGDIRTGFTEDAVFTDEMISYAAKDAEILIPLRREQVRLLRLEAMDYIAGVEMRALPAFAEMWRRGVKVDVTRLRPLIEEARGKAAAIEAALQALLTAHLYWPRMREQEAEDAKLREWQARYDAELADTRSLWEHQTFLDGVVPIWQREFAGLLIPGATKAITPDEVAKWADPETPKGKSEPAGKTRFVKKMMQIWRTQPGNARPTTRQVQIDAPINLNSGPQKHAALGEYIAAYNARTKSQLDPPPNFRRKTLAAYLATYADHPAVVTEVIQPLMDYTKAAKLVSSFGNTLVEMMRETVHEPIPGPIVWGVNEPTPPLTRVAEGRLHAGLRQIGTATGRPSSSRPNLLNMPHDPAFRRCFVASPGMVLVVSDYSQMELRILAQLSQDPVMIAALVAGRDLHLETAAAAFGVPTDKVTDKQRKIAKIINFGISYGMARNGLAYLLSGEGILTTLEEADAYLRSWRNTYRVAARWIESQGVHALKKGWVATPLGRRRYFFKPEGGYDRPAEGKVRREGANHPIQGGNADITKLAMGLVQPEIESMGGSIILQIYDEIVVEVPESMAWLARDVVVSGMQIAAEAVLTAVPVKVDSVVSPSWSEKEALARAAQER